MTGLSNNSEYKEEIFFNVFNFKGNKHPLLTDLLNYALAARESAVLVVQKSQGSCQVPVTSHYLITLFLGLPG